MKKLTKFILGSAAGAAVGTFGFISLVDRLLVDKKWTVPESFATKVSGADVSELKEACINQYQWLEEYGYERFYMTSDNGQKLSGYLIKPEKPSDVYVFCSHGYRSSGKKEYCCFAPYYLKKGFNVFMVDHVASGESEGNFIGFGHYEYKDALKWLDFLTENFGKDIKIIVHGVSMGAATAVLMSGDEDLSENVKMIVSDCGYTSAWDEFNYKLHTFKIPPQPLLTMVNSLNKHRAGYDFRDTNALESVKNAKVPMLFVHGSEDKFVPTFMVYELYSACGSSEKDLLVVDGADHAQSYIKNPAEYEKKLDEFIEKFVKEEPIEA